MKLCNFEAGKAELEKKRHKPHEHTDKPSKQAMVFGSQEEIIAPPDAAASQTARLTKAPPNHPVPEQGQALASPCSWLEFTATGPALEKQLVPKRI